MTIAGSSIDPNEGPGDAGMGGHRLLPAEIVEYAHSHSTPLTGELLGVREDFAKEFADGGEFKTYISGAMEVRLVTAFVQARQAKRVLELGTLVGFGAISMARVMPDDGKVITCEIDERCAQIAQRNFDASPYGDRIELRFGPALETIESLDGPFDVVYMDADKVNYGTYFEAVLPKLSAGGIIVCDNTLWAGDYIPWSERETLKELARFNAALPNDPRVECVVLPFGDGITLIWPTPGTK